MGFFGKAKSVAPSPEINSATKEKEEAKNKARLLETEGENKGAELQANQGASVRKVFGN